MFRRIALLFLLLATAARAQSLPVTGKEVPDLAPFDALMTSFLQDHQLPGASLAIAKNGRLLYARGFGYADKDARTPVQPKNLFRIASTSKPFTAVAILRLAEQGKLDLHAPAFPLLRFQPAQPNPQPDPRLRQITILELLQQRTGFDRDKSFDPMFKSVDFASALGKPPPAMPDDIIRNMLNRPLDFNPGERFAYSNFGYCVLGRIIEQTTGETYERYLREQILAPLHIASMRLGRTLLKDKAPSEVRYYTAKNAMGQSVFNPRGPNVPFPYGVWCLEAMDAHGGWLATAADLVHFTSAITAPANPPLLSQKSMNFMFAPPPNNLAIEKDKTDKPIVWYGCGWMVRDLGNNRINTWHGGLLAGSSCLLVRRTDGVDWAVIFNQDSTPDGQIPADLIDPLLHKAAAAVTHWPEGLDPAKPWP